MNKEAEEQDCSQNSTMLWKKEKFIRVTMSNYSYSLIRVFDELTKGGVVAVPTDTVYGAISLLEHADRLHHLKRRSPDKPLGLFVNDPLDIQRYAHVNVPNALLKNIFPGQVTLLFQRKENALPSTFNSGVSTVGFRIPQNCYIRDICRNYVNRPIVQTSANISGAPLSPLCIQDFKELHDELALVIDMGKITECDGSRAGSTIVDLSVDNHYRIVRNGCVFDNVVQILHKFGLTPLAVDPSAENTMSDRENKFPTRCNGQRQEQQPIVNATKITKM